ncbi:MAG: DUF951 domain-containing protein [Defluviitaleaceae bacterium]|nr:DUF951 domain-containing protein [Defluviitaleaceae bacterium]
MSMRTDKADYQIGDIVYMKKSHPCGCHEWEILRVGMDFRIRCMKCAHLVMLPRLKFEKNVKRMVKEVN